MEENTNMQGSFLNQFKQHPALKDWSHLRLQAFSDGCYRLSGIYQGRARRASLRAVNAPGSEPLWCLEEAGQSVFCPGPGRSSQASPGPRLSSEIGSALSSAPSRVPAPPPGQSGHAPMDGILSALHVRLQDTIAPGDPLFTLESMKMQIQVTAFGAGQVEDIYAQTGDRIQKSQQILKIKERKE